MYVVYSNTVVYFTFKCKKINFAEVPKKREKKRMEVASEKGASTWLTVLPLKFHGFALHKGAFHAALWLQYGWR